MDKFAFEIFNYLVDSGYDSGLLMVIMVMLILIIYLVLENNTLRKERNQSEERLERTYENNLQLVKESYASNQKLANEYKHAIDSMHLQIDSFKSTLNTMVTLISTVVSTKSNTDGNKQNGKK